MKLDCPECGQRLQLPDGQLGRQGRCPKCGAIFRIGDGDAPESAEPTPDWGFEQRPVETPPPAVVPEPIATNKFRDDELWQLRIADGRVFGPVDRATLDQWVREGRVGQDSQLRPAGDGDWQPAQSYYPYLRTGAAGSASTEQGGVYTTVSTSGSSVEPHRGGLILTLGLVGFCCLITGIMAIVMGSSDLNKMKAGQMDRSGEGLTRAGFVIGIISTILGVLGMFGRAANINNINF